MTKTRGLPDLGPEHSHLSHVNYCIVRPKASEIFTLVKGYIYCCHAIDQNVTVLTGANKQPATISIQSANVFGITRINNRDHNLVSRSLFSWLGYSIPFLALSDVTVFLNTEAAHPPGIQTNLPPVVIATVLDGLQLLALSSLQQTVWCRLQTEAQMSSSWQRW